MGRKCEKWEILKTFEVVVVLAAVFVDVIVNIVVFLVVVAT